ncbi:hypothetical protein DPX39_040013600 [Trypanosoma brucei equiperdum]|uniref:Uncharacterized protein n=1 Tax=Trypanosoma brucei equiperdum TaxID=630700 RepID=A0A3L6L8U8_9TRYP|nr:hypothetical protein DPX39_040013600 [Trypanosoma brucei equiperdum]
MERCCTLFVIFLSVCALTIAPDLLHQLVLRASATSVLGRDTLPKLTVSLLGDFNYDILYGRPGGYGPCNQGQASLVTPGCESPLKLVQSVMDDVAKWEGTFTLFSGGLMRHSMETVTPAEMEYTMKEVIGVIASASGVNGTQDAASQPTVLALGGNDLSPANSFSPISAQPQYVQLLRLMLSEGLLTREEHSHMSYCGFYYRDVAGTKIRVIVLNTLLWSNSLRPPLSVGDVDPCGQFPFLQASIEWAKQRDRSVIILGNEPPILNVEEAVRMKSVGDATYYWRNDFREAYLRIIGSNRFTVAAQFFHTGTLGFVASSKLGPPMYIIPSVSPVAGSNPSYIRATLDSNTGRVVSLQQRYLVENGSWVYGDKLEDILHVSLRGMNEYSVEDYLTIAQSEAHWEPFSRMRAGGRYLTEKEHCGFWCRHLIICASVYYEKTDIDYCTTSVLPSRSLGVWLSIISACSGGLALVAALTYGFGSRRIIFSPPPGAEREVTQRLFLTRAQKVYN